MELNIDNTLQLIGRNLHTIRNARKEVLQTVARAIGVSHPALSKIENGRNEALQLHLLIRLCSYYRIPLHQVLTTEVTTLLLQPANDFPGNSPVPEPPSSADYQLTLQHCKEEIEYLRHQNTQLLSMIKER